METIYQDLLKKTSDIIKEHEKIAKLTGENFNVFKILGVESKEVKTHSAFIAELLNPEGSHNQNEIFLKLFIDQLGVKNFKYQNASVEVEKNIGYVSDDKEEGGYIDIIITNTEKQAIIIENKIYAGDQENQLKRYYTYGNKNFNNNFHLIYLTLDGASASEFSTKDLKEGDYIKISYSKDILSWLENCKKEAVNHPILRETIAQYINLVKYLTGQTMEEKEKKEIIELIKSNKDFLLALQKLTENDIMQKATLKSIIEKIKTRIEEKYNPYRIEIDDQSGFGVKDTGFWIYKDGWKYCFYFYFVEDFEKINYGIDYVKHELRKNATEKDLKAAQEKFKKVLGYSQYDKNYEWIWCNSFDEYTKTSWYDLTTDKGTEIFISKIEELIKKLEKENIDELMK